MTYSAQMFILDIEFDFAKHSSYKETGIKTLFAPIAIYAGKIF